ncbi:putative toxin-antitoxin system toxin component, PIN family [Glaciecola sp. 1036]|uniref:putative toxin-antitoxin system toxin component, PIN family n=1 Tax=Alteromonadaceae TaxID=72275 RepID=UPI003CFC0EE1
MKVVIDTNIIINVLLSPSRSSASFKVIEMCLTKEIIPQIGAALFSEYLDVSSRDKIFENSSFTKIEINQILDGFFHVCEWTNINYLWRPNLKDESDNHLVDLAVASEAEFIISYNLKDLTSGELKFHWNVITPEQFLQEKRRK